MASCVRSGLAVMAASCRQSRGELRCVQCVVRHIIDSTGCIKGGPATLAPFVDHVDGRRLRRAVARLPSQSTALSRQIHALEPSWTSSSSTVSGVASSSPPRRRPPPASPRTMTDADSLGERARASKEGRQACSGGRHRRSVETLRLGTGIKRFAPMTEGTRRCDVHSSRRRRHGGHRLGRGDVTLAAHGITWKTVRRAGALSVAVSVRARTDARACLPALLEGPAPLTEWSAPSIVPRLAEEVFALGGELGRDARYGRRAGVQLGSRAWIWPRRAG